MASLTTSVAQRRRAGRRPTIHDVAEAAGVSKSAVSLAIRNQRGVSEATREHILQVAQELGYRSNVWARSLVQGRTGLIGILLQDLGNSYHRDVTAGVEDAAVANDLRLVIGHGRRDAKRLQGELDSLLALGVEGVVIVSSWVPPQYLERIGRRVPLVVVGRLPHRVPGVDTVANRDEEGAKQAVEHLIGLGHTRIAHLTGSARPAAMHRRGAFSEVMRRTFPDVDPQVEGPEQLEAAIKYLVFQIQQEKGAPTAVFTQNDRVAADLVGACLDAGLNLPEQLSIVGYDNSSVCQMLRPQLTTVDQPRARMGELALEMLRERIAGRTDDKHITIAPKLVVRDSTAAPRG
ncbi:LacI family DNA-binding transcriptional regulator [Nesterenkonia alkaliphila]|uniref:LacI family DNA-binding transcriptional regulator n=1 Tax=Nesterenkonia alkaliphila TaxID=1463631 RepID=A0A7K1UL97_9MICC|nr:LacI family DNA-binding transcriptional regulator [Nesterenkonia alkaliphila]MVT27194.1 LacI family DNA-binding transcriptional regulator [Nesterenkonia alkaliphila]